MAVIAFPTFSRPLPYTQWEFGQEPNDYSHTSPHSGQTQTVEMPGTRWAHSLRLQGLSTEERLFMSAFFAQLRGRANRYTLWDVLNPVPKGDMRGSMTVAAGIAQGAVTFNLSGGTPFTFLKSGDKLSIGGELKIITALVGTNGAGECNGIPVEPPFRNAVSAGAAIVWNKPAAKFIRVSSPWRMAHTPPRFGEIALDGVEDFS